MAIAPPITVSVSSGTRFVREMSPTARVEPVRTLIVTCDRSALMMYGKVCVTAQLPKVAFTANT